jgi:hypothetical protein
MQDGVFGAIAIPIGMAAGGVLPNKALIRRK